MARIDELRLMTRVAKQYYEQGERQCEIAESMHLSQSTVSRLLKRAEQEQIVRVSVGVPLGVYTEFEAALAADMDCKMLSWSTVCGTIVMKASSVTLAERLLTIWKRRSIMGNVSVSPRGAAR